MIEQGVDIDHSTDDGFTPLQEAILKDQPEIAKLLIEKGANVEGVGHSDNEGDNEYDDEYDDCEYDGDSVAPLYSAIEANMNEVAKLLIEKGATTNDLDEYSGESALMIACTSGNEEMVTYLLDRKADLNDTTASSQNALHLAVESYHNNETIIKLLIDAGVDKELVDGYGNTPLKLAQEKGKYVELLS